MQARPDTMGLQNLLKRERRIPFCILFTWRSESQLTTVDYDYLLTVRNGVSGTHHGYVMQYCPVAAGATPWQLRGQSMRDVHQTPR